MVKLYIPCKSRVSSIVRCKIHGLNLLPLCVIHFLK
jgi:hypothetical protein